MLATVAQRAMLVILACFALLLSLVVVPNFLGYPTVVVQGGSMGESLPPGSLAITRWVAADEVQPGDVILIGDKRSGTSQRIHRVVSIEELGGELVAVTKGDANEAADPGFQMLKGQVAVHTYTIPYLGYTADFLRTPLGWTLFVLLPISVLCLLTLRDIWRGEDKPRAVSGTAADSGRSPSRPLSGPRRHPAPLLLPLAGPVCVALLAGLVVLAVGLADSDDNLPAGAASTNEPSAATEPVAARDGTEWQFNLTY